MEMEDFFDSEWSVCLEADSISLYQAGWLFEKKIFIPTSEQLQANNPDTVTED